VLKKVIVSQIVEKFPTLYGILRVTAIFATFHPLVPVYHSEITYSSVSCGA
jgi:hypothetical protein